MLKYGTRMLTCACCGPHPQAKAAAEAAEASASASGAATGCGSGPSGAAGLVCYASHLSAVEVEAGLQAGTLLKVRWQDGLLC